MTNINLTPFNERVKNAETMESIMSKYFHKNSDMKDSYNTQIIPKRPRKHYSYNNLSSFYSSKMIQKEKNNKQNKHEHDDILHNNNDLKTIIQRGKKIKKQVLSTIISMQGLENLDIDSLKCDNDNDSNQFGLFPENSIKTKKLITHLCFSPKKKHKTPPLALLNSSPFFSKERSVLKPSFDVSSSKRSIHELSSRRSLNASAYLDKKTKVSKADVYEYKLEIHKEINYRCLLKQEYEVYDSCSDEELDTISFVLYPQSIYLFIWNLLILIVTLYYVLIFPFCLAFIHYFGFWMIGFEFLSEIIYIIDVFIQFIIPIPSEESHEDYNCNLYNIAIHYIHGWFCFDVIIAFPYCSIINMFYYTQTITLHSSATWLLIKLIKIVKMLKLILNSSDSMVHESSIIDEFIPIKLKRLVEFFFFFSIFNHTLACVWIFIGHVSYPNWILKQNIQDSNDIHIYISAFYYTLASIYTVGYGDIYPTTNNERYFNIALQALGLFIYSYVISSMTTILKTSPKAMQFKHKNDLFEKVKVDYKVNNKLYFKIKKFLRHSYKLNLDERALFLQELPNPIKNQLISHMYTDLKKFEIFSNTSIDFKTRVILSFKPACYSRDEIVIKRGNYIEDVIFIKRGCIDIEYQYNNQIIKLKKLHSGDHFGEVDMLLNHESKFDLVIKSKLAELLLLSKECLIKIGEEFPQLFYKIRKKSLIQFALIKMKLKQKKKDIDAFKLKKCEMIIDFDNDDERNEITLNSNCIDHSYGNDNDDDKERYAYNQPIISEIIPEKSSDEEQSLNERILQYNYNENDIKDNNELDSNNLEEELNSINPSIASLHSRHHSISSKKIKKRLSSRRNSINITNNKSPIYKGNDQRRQSLSSQSLFCLNLNPITSPRFNANKKDINYISTPQVNKESKFNMLSNKSSGDSIDRPSESMIESINSSRVIQRKSNKILRNIKENSMNINCPSQFYNQIFDKWNIDNQIKRMKSIWEGISAIYNNNININNTNSANTVKQKRKSSLFIIGS